MRKLVKRLARRSKTAIIVYKILDNRRLKKRVKAGDIETLHGSTQLNQDVSKSLRYIEKQFEDYLKYAGFSPADLQGKRVLELGPGDNLGVALRFIAAGAASVVCLDRFYSKRRVEHEIEIYKALRSRLGLDERKRFDEAISISGDINFNAAKLQGIYGSTLEGVACQLASDSRAFDLILSCAVLEEIYEPGPAFAAMDRLLTSGGMLVHKIDLGDYGIFRDQGMHPLTFLTISEAIYKRMASESGLPNRKRLGYYIAKMGEQKYQSRFFVTSTVQTGRLEPAVSYNRGSLTDDSGSRLINEIRARLASEFKDMGDEELLIDGIWLVAKKPL